MQCNQSSGERFPGEWEGLPLPGLPAPLPEIILNPTRCDSKQTEVDSDGDQKGEEEKVLE